MRMTLENLSEAGFNLAEMGWATHEQSEEALHYGEQLGLDILFQDFSVFGGMQEHNLDRHIPEQTAKDVADHIKPYRNCFGYYVWDEPYVHDQLVEADYQCGLFRKADPDRIAFTVAIPSYNSKYTWQNGMFEKYLRDYCETIDPEVLSLDYYPVGLPGYTAEKQLDDSLMWCDLGLMRKLCMERHMPLWFYYQAIPMYEWKDFTFPMVRMMMYSAVLYGAKGLQQFTTGGATTDRSGRRGDFFEQQKEIHHEFKMLGNTLMALESRYVFHSEDLLPDCEYSRGLSDSPDMSEILADEPLQKRISVGEYTDGYGNEYILVLNRDFCKSAETDIPLKKASHIYKIDRNDGHERYLCDTDTVHIELEPGDAVLMRIDDASNGLCTLEYILEKNGI